MSMFGILIYLLWSTIESEAYMVKREKILLFTFPIMFDEKENK